MSRFILFRSRALAASRFRRSIELEVFKQSALSLAEQREDDDANELLVELEFVDFDDEELARELVDLAMIRASWIDDNFLEW